MKIVASSPLRKKLKSCCIYSSLLLACAFAQGEENVPPPPPSQENTSDSAAEAVTPPPPLPPDDTASDSRNIPQPEVTIIHRQETTIEEYRVDGKLRFVKITPKQGPPYYMVDKDGDGTLETRYSDLQGTPNINQWLLLEW